LNRVLQEQVLFDHLGRLQQDLGWNCQAEHLGRLEVDDQFELPRLLDGKIRWFGAFRDLVDVGAAL